MGPVKGGSAGAKSARGRRRRLGAPMSEINVTPFVDVMLVLLIIFMVAAPLLTVGGVPVDLPESNATALPQPQAEPTVVSIDAAGGIFLGDVVVTLEQLPGRVAEEASAPSDRIYLRADGSVAHARVAEVMGELYGGGFRNIALVSKRRAETAEP
ncbi:MAG: ExbD/TolR family protein [Pseudomonadota bacterium]